MTKLLHDITHYIPAIKEWLSVLEGLRQDNVLLKSSLSHALQQEVSRSFIETAEEYQQRFLYKDQLIELLRHDLTALLDESALLTPQELHHQWEKRADTLGKDMQKLVAEFNGMKTAFDRSLQENC